MAKKMLYFFFLFLALVIGYQNVSAVDKQKHNDKYGKQFMLTSSGDLEKLCEFLNFRLTSDQNGSVLEYDLPKNGIVPIKFQGIPQSVLYESINISYGHHEGGGADLLICAIVLNHQKIEGKKEIFTVIMHIGQDENNAGSLSSYLNPPAFDLMLLSQRTSLPIEIEGFVLGNYAISFQYAGSGDKRILIAITPDKINGRQWNIK